MSIIDLSEYRQGRIDAMREVAEADPDWLEFQMLKAADDPVKDAWIAERVRKNRFPGLYCVKSAQ